MEYAASQHKCAMSDGARIPLLEDVQPTPHRDDEVMTKPNLPRASANRESGLARLLTETVISLLPVTVSRYRFSLAHPPIPTKPSGFRKIGPPVFNGMTLD